MGADEWTTVGVRRKTRKRLEEVQKALKEEYGMHVSIEGVINYLITFWERHREEDQGKAEAEEALLA